MNERTYMDVIRENATLLTDLEDEQEPELTEFARQHLADIAEWGSE